MRPPPLQHHSKVFWALRSLALLVRRRRQPPLAQPIHLVRRRRRLPLAQPIHLVLAQVMRRLPLAQPIHLPLAQQLQCIQAHGPTGDRRRQQLQWRRLQWRRQQLLLIHGPISNQQLSMIHGPQPHPQVPPAAGLGRKEIGSGTSADPGAGRQPSGHGAEPP